MLLYDGCFRRYDYVENDVDIDVCPTTIPQTSQQKDFREIRRNFSIKVVSHFLLDK
jgi:hypothetical protein